MSSAQQSLSAQLSRFRVVKEKKEKRLQIQKRMLFYTVYRTKEDVHEAEIYRIVARLCTSREVLEDIDYIFKPSGLYRKDAGWIRGSVNTLEDIDNGLDGEDALKAFIETLNEYIDTSDIRCKIMLCGFGNHSIDDMLLRRWFQIYRRVDDFNRLFYAYTVDLKGAASIFFVDVADSIKVLNLETAAIGGVRGAKLSQMQNPAYRVSMIQKLFYSRFAPTTHIHTREAVIKKMNQKRYQLNNTKFYNQ